MRNGQKNMIEQQAMALFNIQQESLGKTEARQSFLPLVDELSHSAKAIEITDHQMPVAVLVGYSQWSAIISKLAVLMKPAKATTRVNLIGSVKIIGDLEAGSKRAAEQFRKSINRSSKILRGELGE